MKYVLMFLMALAVGWSVNVLQPDRLLCVAIGLLLSYVLDLIDFYIK